MVVWNRCTLGDIITFQRGYDLPKSEMAGGEYPVVGSNGIIGYHNKYTTDTPSITIGRSGNVGKPYIVYGKTWSHNTTLFIKEFHGVDPVFIYYFLQTLDLGSYAGGSAVPTLNRNHIHTLPISIPKDIIKQKRIGEILQIIDTKIYLNEQINKNLLQQVTAFFHHFFDEYENEKNFIGLLGDVARFKYGTMPKKGKLDSGKYVAFSGYQVVGKYPERMFTDPQLIVVARGVGGCGEIKYTPTNCFLTNLSIAILTDNTAIEDYLFHYLRLHDTKVMNTGSAQPQITVSTLEKYQLPIPPAETLETFSDMIQPYKKLYRECLAEVDRLASLRDTLLPRLMSGELDVLGIDL